MPLTAPFESANSWLARGRYMMGALRPTMPQLCDAAALIKAWSICDEFCFPQLSSLAVDEDLFAPGRWFESSGQIREVTGLPDGAQVRLHPASFMFRCEKGSSSVAVLIAGSAEFELPDETEFYVMAGQFHIEGSGSFTVTVCGQHDLEVDVSRGSVRITPIGDMQ